jgi:enoyl-CoA hydratase
MSVTLEQRGSVLIVTLNRPAQHNALNGEMMSAIGRAFADAESDDSVAVVVLTGAGDRTFCAGLDLKAFAASGSTPASSDGPGLSVLMGRTYPKPIVAAANGSALAGGFELLLACDLIVAGEHAKFGIPEVKRGLVAAGGGILTLPQRIPLAIALELGLTGETIDATRAQELGLVNRVVPASSVLAEATRLAELIAANAPLAVRFTKDQMYAATQGVDDDARRRFNELIPFIFASKDAYEGARAFAEKRAPVWVGQ